MPPAPASLSRGRMGPWMSRVDGREVRLRNVKKSDLPTFFTHQQDPAATYMAALTPKDPAEREAFDVHWGKIVGEDRIAIRTIVVDERP